MLQEDHQIAQFVILFSVVAALCTVGPSALAQEQQKRPVQQDTSLPENDGPYHRTFLSQGPQDGALYFKAGFPGPHMTPRRFVLDAEGNSYFAERQVPSGDSGQWRSRIQKFSPAGKFLLQFDLQSLREKIGKQAQFTSLMVDDIFLDSKGRILVLVRVSGSEHTTGVFVGVYDTNGRLQAAYRLAETGWPDDTIEKDFLDASGYLWLNVPRQTTIFDPRGGRSYASDRPLSFVDADGHHYVNRSDPDVSSVPLDIEVFDRRGEKLAMLSFPPETGPVKIDGGDPRTFLYAWSAESAGDRALMHLFRLDKKLWRLMYAGEVILPRTRESGSGDFTFPVEESNREDLTVLRGNQLVMLWYSDKRSWLLKIDIPNYLERYGYLSKYVRFLRDDIDLTSASIEDLRRLRNEIFARHGRTFTSKDLQEYFTKQSWYKVDPGYRDDRLFSLESELVERLGKLEKHLAAEK